MALGEGYCGAHDDPAGGIFRRIGVDAGRGEDVVQALPARINRIRRHVASLAATESVLLVLGPAPGIVHAVARRAILEQVEVGGRDGPASRLLGRVVGRAQAAVRVQDAPDVADGGVGGDEAVGRGEGQHVEVAEGDGEVAAFGGGADEFGDFPGLGGAVADVGIAAVAPVGGMSLSGRQFWGLVIDGMGRKLTWVLKTSMTSFLPAPNRTFAHATPLPTYQSPLQNAVGRPFRGYLNMELSSMGQRLKMARPPPKAAL